MTDLRDWSITASANNGAALNGYLAEGVNYTLVSDAFREQQAQLARWLADNNGTLQSTGTSATYTLAINQGLTTYKDGDTIVWRAHLPNSASATMQFVVAGTTSSAMPIVHTDTSATLEGDILPGAIYRCVYKSASANFQVLNPSAYRALHGALAGTTFTAADGLLLMNEGPTYQSANRVLFPLAVGSQSGPLTITASFVNTAINWTGTTTADAFTFNSGIGQNYCSITIVNESSVAGPTIASGTATVTSASGNLVVQQGGIATVWRIDSTTWKATGDLQA